MQIVGMGLLNAPGYGPTPAVKNLVMMAGQSNDDGQGNVNNVTIEPGIGAAYPAVQQMIKQSDGFTNPMVYNNLGPRDLAPRTATQFGIELSLMRRLNEQTPNVWINGKDSVDTTSIATHWDPDAANPTPDNMFDDLINFVALIQTTLSCAITHWIWIQGERDADDLTNSLAYTTNLANLVARFRAVYPGVPFLFNQLHINCNRTYKDNVRACQLAYLLQDTNSWLIENDDLILFDGLHYDSDSLVTMGNRFAATKPLNNTATLSSVTVVAPGTGSYDIGAGNQQFYARGRYSNRGYHNDNATATWQSSDNNVATVNASGVVTPVGTGTCNITATVGAVSSAPFAVTITGGAPAFQAAGALFHGTTNQTAVWPTHQADDWGFLIVESTVGVAAPAGWTELTNSPSSVGANFLNVFKRKATSSSETNPTVTLGTNNHIDGLIVTIRGANTTEAVDVTAKANSGGSGVTTVTWPTVTTGGNNERILLIGAWSIDDAGPILVDGSLSNVNLSGLTEHFDGGTIDGNGGGVFVCSGVKSAAGATGTTGGTASQAILWNVLTVAVKP